MRYLIARVFQGILALFGVSLITFYLPALNFRPIGLAATVLGRHGVTVAVLRAWVQSHGLNQPLIVRYWQWLWAALHGNFGISYVASAHGRIVTVNTVLSGTIWRSVWLVFVPTVLSVLVAVPIGLSQAIRRNKPYDHFMTTFIYVLYSTPAVIVCIVLSYYVGVRLKWAQPLISANAQLVSPHQFPVWMAEHFSQFALPFIAIMFLTIGAFTRFMRGSSLDTLVQDHVRTARAKGASETRVLFRHVMRPSLIPMITIVGLLIPSVIGGALIVEDIFNYPGMGVLAVNSVFSGDFTVVMAITIFTAFLTVAGNFIADVLVAVADPRVRLGAVR